MQLSFTTLILLLITLIKSDVAQLESDEIGEAYTDEPGQYTHEWAAEIHGGLEKCHEVADRHGFVCVGEIGALENMYLLEHKRLRKRSIEPHGETHDRLVSDGSVKWAEQQRILSRRKRDAASQIGIDPALGSSAPARFNDELFNKTWYLRAGAKNGFDMNVDAAWRRGYTGYGSVVTILDDGIEWNHPDLHSNYDLMASADINDNDNDPMPRYDATNENRHGTRCAGEVAAVSNNKVCSVGIAYNSRIGGVRMLDGRITDSVEARSLSLNPQYIHFYSASWGPDDDGRSLDGPGVLADRAIRDGIAKGRDGLGSLFIWASGNGGRDGDSCACDGYTNSIFTLSVSSVTAGNKQPWYLEQCASTLAATYSSGDPVDPSIITTDLHGICTEGHSGTSASAPLAAAICALALEANPKLTWRDMQYITLLAANDAPFADAEWTVNGLQRRVSLKYGYGLMDADAMVRLAEVWITVPPQHVCKSAHGGSVAKPVVLGKGVTHVRIAFDSCIRSQSVESHVSFAEHVQCVLSINEARRGDLSVALTSPKGTRSVMLPFRPNDGGTDFADWPFMSVQFWGEQPAGEWLLEVDNRGSLEARLFGWQLVVFGTDSPPIRLSESLRFERLANATRLHLATVPEPTRRDSAESWLVSPRVDRVLELYSAKIERRSNNASLCHAECYGRCTGPSAFDCLRCRNFQVLRSNVDECVRQCPVGTYAVQSLCKMCHEACLSCVGPSDDNCTACMTPQNSAFAEAVADSRSNAVRHCELPNAVGFASWVAMLDRVFANRVFLISLVVASTAACVVVLVGIACYFARRRTPTVYSQVNSDDDLQLDAVTGDGDGDGVLEEGLKNERGSPTQVVTNGKKHAGARPYAVFRNGTVRNNSAHSDEKDDMPDIVRMHRLTNAEDGEVDLMMLEERSESDSLKRVEEAFRGATQV